MAPTVHVDQRAGDDAVGAKAAGENHGVEAPAEGEVSKIRAGLDDGGEGEGIGLNGEV